MDIEAFSKGVGGLASVLNFALFAGDKVRNTYTLTCLVATSFVNSACNCTFEFGVTFVSNGQSWFIRG